jgi:signal transduction histidine kinase
MGTVPAAGSAVHLTLASMRRTVEETVAELRSIASGLRPSVLDDLGLVASINQVLDDATRRQGFESSFDVEGPVRRLASDVELAVFRIAQEAVTNVVRHADAHRVVVTLEFADAGLGLRVGDDGVGFDRDGLRYRDDGHSLGLPGMGERARLVGGRLKVRSQVGRGTTVEAWIPAEALDGP